MNPTHSPRPLSLLLILGLLPLLGACEPSPKVWIEKSHEFLIPSKSIQSVQVRTHNGAIRSEGMAKLETTKVIAKIRAGGQTQDDAKACLAAIQLKVEEKDGILHAGYDFDRRSGWQAQVSFQIQQAATTPLDAQTHNGAIAAIGLRAQIVGETHNGAVSAKACQGEWKLTTHNGSITVQGKSASLTLLTHNGSISATLEQKGPIAGSLTTHNGNVSVAVAKGSSFRIRCRTSNGRIQNHLALTEVQQEKKTLRGQLGTGTTELTLDTHNGSIRLSPQE